MEGSLQHWFGGLTVVYDGDPAAPSAAPSVASAAATEAAGADCEVRLEPRLKSRKAPSKAAAQSYRQQVDVLQAHLPPPQQEQQEEEGKHSTKGAAGQQPERYMFGFQPHGLYPTGGSERTR